MKAGIRRVRNEAGIGLWVSWRTVVRLSVTVQLGPFEAWVEWQ